MHSELLAAWLTRGGNLIEIRTDDTAPNPGTAKRAVHDAWMSGAVYQVTAIAPNGNTETLSDVYDLTFNPNDAKRAGTYIVDTVIPGLLDRIR